MTLLAYLLALVSVHGRPNRHPPKAVEDDGLKARQICSWVFIHRQNHPVFYCHDDLSTLPTKDDGQGPTSYNTIEVYAGMFLLMLSTVTMNRITRV